MQFFVGFYYISAVLNDNLSLSCSTLISTMNQLHSILLFIVTSSSAISLFMFSHSAYIYLEQKGKVNQESPP